MASSLGLLSASPEAEAATSAALRFDGTSGYVEVPAGLEPAVPVSLTIEAWVNPDPLPGRRYVLARGGYRLAVEPSGGGVRALFGLSTLAVWRWVGSPELAPGRWYHVAGTYDGTTMRLFVDGNQVGSALTFGGIDVLGGPLRIGTAETTTFFPGLIDEVRVSSIVRYSGSFAVPTGSFAPDANTRGLWHFDEGAGTSTADASGVTGAGALIGGLTWTSATPWSTAPAPTPTPPPTRTPTATATPTQTAVPPSGTPTDTPIASATDTPFPTATKTPVPTATKTPVPTATETPVPTATDTTVPTATPTIGLLQPGYTSAGPLELTATYQSIGVYANFAGDADGDNLATLEYRKVGEATWRRGMDLTVDRRAAVSGADASYTNPFRNQWRGAVLMTQADTEYEIRLTFADPDGVSGGNPLVSRVRTRSDDPPTGGGATYYVSSAGADTAAGTAGAPWRSLQRAAGAVNAGDTVLVRAGTYAPVSLSRSGSASNWVSFQAYPGERPVISSAAGSGKLISLTGSYVRVGGFELSGGQFGVVVGGSAHDVIVEKNIIRGQRSSGRSGVPIQIGDTFSTQSAVSNVTVQDNDVRADTLPEPESDAILVQSASGGHVIRRNKIVFYYPGGAVHGTDCIGGLPNFAPHGGFYRDTDVSDNHCEGATDEGIEIDGGNANVRVWGNTIRGANLGFSVTPVFYGPVYVFRNTVLHLQDHWVGSCVGVKDGEGGSGPVYFYHNTFYSPSGTGCSNSVKGFAKYGGGDAQSNVVVKNNILHFWGRLYETGDKSADHNLNYVEPASGDKVAEWNGTDYFSLAAFRAGSGQERNGLWGAATFVDAVAGDYRLATGSLGVDGGVLLPGFNDASSGWAYRGTAPDMGAFES